jgi:hypothetical protein
LGLGGAHSSGQAAGGHLALPFWETFFERLSKGLETLPTVALRGVSVGGDWAALAVGGR